MRTISNTKSHKPLLSVEETAVLLGETRSTLYRAIKAGTFPLPIFRIGRRVRIPRKSVERLIAGLPLAPPTELTMEVSLPSGWTRDQLASADASDSAVPGDSRLPT